MVKVMERERGGEEEEKNRIVKQRCESKLEWRRNG